MCENCKLIEQCFEAAASNAVLNFSPVYHLLSEMLKQNRISIYAGDCNFDSMLEELKSEKHYTVKFYLECEKCHEIYFFGGCVRGVPSYRKVEHISDEDIDKTIYGRVGSYFHRASNAVEIDLTHVDSPRDFQYLLKDILHMPEFYGLNWDAFWDGITGLIALPDELRIRGWNLYKEKCPDDAGVFEQLMEDYNSLGYYKRCECVFL